MRNQFLILLAAITLWGCGGSKKTADMPISPSWVQARPASQMYYVGIGSARKTNDANGYMQTAKQNALADLASDISINISSNSVLSAFESQQRFFEDYSSTIKADAQKELEGYEVVETWEDASTYWIYFRLLKETYRKITDDKKQKAAAKALDFYDKALQNIETGEVRVALVLLVKALEPIKPYFAETIMANYNGKDIFLGNEIVQSISTTLNKIAITGPRELKVKTGKALQQNELRFFVNYNQSTPQKGIPLKASYTEKPITQNKSTTETNGYAGFGIDAVRSSKPIEKFKVNLDFEAIVSEATTDFTIRKVLARFNVPTFEVDINIVKPVFAIQSIEKNIGNLTTSSILAEAVKRKLVESSMPIVEKPNEADYVISIDASTVQISESNGYKQAALTATVSVKSIDGIEVYRKTLDRVLGSHFDIEMAGRNAYAEATKRVENTIMREIIEVVVKGKSSY
ncbi:MAG TPA: LPP20 family lipoprotein [Tenuifilaceae bacterium]|nr:LPP20 family lipoprotein [Tenuifilaceae bacterium]HPI44492.1 LPP20 family lipoprotein [Tenuifilaceae bacterium]HPN21407.1 LPP20 family lipoprotein [Tenuifilaceae bacterium]